MQFRCRRQQRNSSSVQGYWKLPCSIDSAPIGLRETPAGDVAHVVYWGRYSEMHPAHQAAQTGAMREGHRLTGVSWEVYGDWADDPAKLRTDIYYQLEGDARG